MKRDAILAALPGLSKPDLEAIAAVISTLLGQHPASAAKAAEGRLAWLYDAVLVTLGAKIPYDRFANAQHGKRFIQQGEEFLLFTEQNFPKQMKKKISGSAIIRLLLT